MKKIVLGLAFLGIVACQQNKIGYVDNTKLMNAYQEKVDMEAKFKKKVDALSKKRDSISRAFQEEARDFQAKAQKMSQKNAQEAYGKMQQKGQMIGQQLQQEEQQLQASSQTQMDSLVSKVKKQIKAYGKEHGYTYILGGGDGGSVLYGTEANDITDAISKILNDTYKK